MITLFNTIELWNREGAWCRPSEWVFGIDRNCGSGCIILELGFCGITWLRNGCGGDRS